MTRKHQHFFLCRFLFLCVLVSVFFAFNVPRNASAISDTSVKFKKIKTIPLGAVGNSATIAAGKYFIYTEGKLNGGKTNIYRCKWPELTSCKEIIHSVDVGHANITDSKWGSQYFRVIDFHPKNNLCFDAINEKKVSSSKCGKLPPDWDNRKKSGGSISSTKWQDLTVYGDYLLRGYASANRIEVRKNSKSYKVLKPSVGGELEGVFVDGGTGVIYFTTATKRSDSKYSDPHNLNLYKITSFTLPALETKSSKEDNKGDKTGKSGDDSGSGGSSSTTPSTPPTPSTPADTGESKDDDVQLAPGHEGQCATILTFWCNSAESDGENTIKNIISFVITTMSIGIATLGTIGIIWCGYLMMSARDNEQQVMKARRRMIEIVIGILLWVLIMAIIALLLPNGEEAAQQAISRF